MSIHDASWVHKMEFAGFHSYFYEPVLLGTVNYQGSIWGPPGTVLEVSYVQVTFPGFQKE